jgi:SnoaL-like protein
MQPQPAVAASLARWRQAVATKDLRELSSLLRADVILRSPIGFKPFQGAQEVARILTTVSEVLSNFQYQREFVSGDGHSVALEFSASIGDKQLKGMDVLRFAENGTITELEILVRPFNALQALGAAMAKRMGVSRFRILLARWRAMLRPPR